MAHAEIPQRRILREAMVVLAFMGMAFLTVVWQPIIADEVHHFGQMEMFAKGRFALDPMLTQLPGYHLIVASVMRFLGQYSLQAARIISFAFNLLSLPLFYALARTLKMRPAEAETRTLQYVFLPILFPLFFLLYTDGFSLLAVLLAVLLSVRREYVLAAVAGFLSITFRQNNIVWVGFTFFIFLWQEWPTFLKLFPLSMRRLQRVSLNIASVFAFLVVIGAFMGFVSWNGGVAIGDRGMHPFPSFHTGNVFFCLFLSFFIFLPLHVANIPRIADCFRRSQYLVPLIIAFFCLYLLTFVNDHPYNQRFTEMFFRHRILIFMTSSAVTKVFVFIPMAISALSFAVTRLRHPAVYLLYPLTMVLLVESWLIEQRYYLIPFVLFLAFRESRSRQFEYLSAAYSFVWTLIVFTPVALRWFFL